MEGKKAANILYRSKEAAHYTDLLLKQVQRLFRTSKINRYDYETIINVLNCNMLVTEDITKQLEDYLTELSDRRLHIDMIV